MFMTVEHGEGHEAATKSKEEMKGMMDRAWLFMSLLTNLRVITVCQSGDE